MVLKGRKYVGAVVLDKVKEAIENTVPDRYISISHFVQEAIYEKLKRENLI